MKNEKKIYHFGELEGNRRFTGNSPKFSKKFQGEVCDTEVGTPKTRRKFSKEYKLKILNEIDEATKPGRKGAILRREGLYSSNIKTWQEQLEKGKLNKKLSNKYQKKIAELSKQNRKLTRELNQAKLIIEAQKKISEIIDLTILS
jgi:transposase-like protein